MPLFNCCECKAHEAGYWHCRDQRQNRRDNWFLVLKIGLVLLGFAVFMTVLWFNPQWSH